MAMPVVSGVGIHSGQHYELTASQRIGLTGSRGVAQPRGAVFYCIHPLHSKQFLEAPAHLSRLSGTSRSTALVVRGPQKAKGELKTIEHLMAAYAVSGFPDLNFFIRELSSENKNEVGESQAELLFEIPILKGSAAGFEMFFENPVPRATVIGYRVVKPFLFEYEGKKIEFLPLKTLSESWVTRLEVQVEFGPRLKQEFQWEMNWENPKGGRDLFWNSISKARTFGFSHELVDLKSRGLGRGASLDNAILIKDGDVMNPEGFLMPNELAAHKLLDALGDFALMGGPIIGSIRCSKAGHALHLRALSEAFKNEVFEKFEHRLTFF
jgi:UDP-3-O-[3-hydroxymyristoyl] N-acetylglucosamine deacetylase